MKNTAKRLLALALCIILATGAIALSGCSADKQTTTKDTTTNNKSSGKIRIVCTIFPQYDWVKQIIGDRADKFDVTLLLDNGVDLHSYQPTAADMIKVSDCDMFVYVGGESDGWVDDALKNKQNDNMIVVNMLDVLGDTVKEEEVVDGMEAEEEEKAEEEEGPEYDEHVWLSLKNAEALCSELSEKICELDPEGADIYTQNAAVYDAKLKLIDDGFKTVVDGAKVKTLVFGDRFPFRYLVDDYGIEYYAAFVGCSAETEASFETIKFLAGKVDENKLKSVIAIEGSDQSIAKTIIKNTADKNQTILVLNSMQSVTSKDVEAGTSYIEIMENNLKVIKEALA